MAGGSSGGPTDRNPEAATGQRAKIGQRAFTVQLFDRDAFARHLLEAVRPRADAVAAAPEDSYVRQQVLQRRKRRRGSLKAVATLWGMEQATLEALAAGRRSRVNVATLRLLRERVGKFARQFLDAVLPPGGREILARYERWVRLAVFGRVSDDLPHPIAAVGLSKSARERLGGLYLAVDGPLRRAVDRFEEIVRVRGHSAERRLLGFRRVVAPLAVPCYASDGVERGLHEMSNAEVIKFLVAGFRRECILLDRENDFERAAANARIQRQGTQEVRPPAGFLLSLEMDESPVDDVDQLVVGSSQASATWDFVAPVREVPDDSETVERGLPDTGETP